MKVTTEQYPVMSESARKAIEVALDELDSYIGTMGEDIAEVQNEAGLEKLVWASKKLHALLMA